MKKRFFKIRDEKCFQLFKIYNLLLFIKLKYEIISFGFKYYNIYIYGNYGNIVYVLYNLG